MGKTSAQDEVAASVSKAPIGALSGTPGITGENLGETCGETLGDRLDCIAISADTPVANMTNEDLVDALLLVATLNLDEAPETLGVSRGLGESLAAGTTTLVRVSATAPAKPSSRNLGLPLI